MMIKRRRYLRLITLGTCLLAFSGIMALLHGPSGHSFLMPGPLSRFHSPLSDDCSRCHVSTKDFFKPISHGFTVDVTSMEESSLCVNCHDFGPTPHTPHSIPSEFLNALSRRNHNLTRILADMSGIPRSPSGEMMCASCHREHGGSEAMQSQGATGSCNACHSQPTSFAATHPGFDSYPSPHSAGLAFDHVSHETKHLPGDRQSFRCENCHHLGTDRTTMLTRSYETSCTSCHHHEGQILGEGRTEEGVAFLCLPGVDVETLEEHGVSMGSWIATAEDEYEGVATPFMELFLDQDPNYFEFEKDRILIQELDLLDLTDADDFQIEAVVRYLAAIQRLIRDLGQDKTKLRRILGRTLELESTSGEIETLSRSFSSPALEGAWKDWLGGGSEDVASHPKPRSWSPSGAWYRDDDTLTLFYRPVHHRDPFLKTWLDALGGSTLSSSAGKNLFNKLTDERSRCVKCHTVATDSDGKSRVNWFSKRESNQHGFSKFSHAPHLLMTNGCETCHLASETASESHIDEKARISRGSGFANIAPAVCAKCHEQPALGGDCTLCHNYHIQASSEPQGSAKGSGGG